MRTAVIILNWNTAAYLGRFIPGVLASLGSDDRLIVADSGSTDNSMEFMKERFPQVQTIPLEQNFGFTGGYNRAIAQVLDAEEKPQYIVLLNSDIDVPQEWLRPLTEWMDSHPECAACAPKLHALDPSGDDWVRTNRFEYAGAAGGRLTLLGYPYCRGRFLRHVSIDHGQYDKAPANVDWATGACLMVRSSVWKEIGGLDDRFFAHMEEIDWCWRARRAGYRITVVPSSVVYHIGGGTLKPSSPFKLKLNFRNSLLMLRSNLPGEVGNTLTKVIIFVRFLLDRCAQLVYLLTGKKEYAKAVSEAYREYHNFIGK